jgi:hypothetical protein
MRGPTSSTVLILSRMTPDPDLNTAFLEQSEIKLMNSDPGPAAIGLAQGQLPRGGRGHVAPKAAHPQ